MIFEDLKNKYPLLSSTANYLEKNCYFYRRVLEQIRNLNPDYQFGEELCSTALRICNNELDVYYKKLHSLIEFSLEFLKLQLELEKTGKYRYSSLQETEETPEPDYLWALFFSQFFWAPHNAIFDFFSKNFASPGRRSGEVLEIPAGTGIFLAAFLEHNPRCQGSGIDISEKALAFAKKVLETRQVPLKPRLAKKDFFQYQPAKKFDYIICGEFLEHVENPLAVLKKLRAWLNDDGEIFVTVAVWAAIIDHIYLYKNVEEVKNHIAKAKLAIKKESIQNVFKSAPQSQKRAPIVYGAILTKQ